MAANKDLDFQTSILGEDYYVRIKDVIDRINERRNSVEASAADLLRRAISKPVKLPAPSFEPTFRRKRRKEVAEESSPKPISSPTKLDFSWKEGGEIFPKKSSRVGDEYQATIIPQAGISEKGVVLTSDT